MSLVLAVLFTMRLVFGIAVAAVAGLALAPGLLDVRLHVAVACQALYGNRKEQPDGADEVKGRGYVSRDAPSLGLGCGNGGGRRSHHDPLSDRGSVRGRLLCKPAYGCGCLPIILFLWLGRIWLLAGRCELDEDPIRFAIGDRASLALGIAMVVVFLIAWRL